MSKKTKIIEYKDKPLDQIKSDIDNLFEKAVEFGTPQVLINCAGIFSRQRLQDVTFEQAQKVMNLNLLAAILTSRAFAERLNTKFKNAQSVVGKIIYIADVGGIRPWAQYVLYCSSKAGLIGATKALAKELAPAVCVSAVAPGIVTWPSHFDEPQKSDSFCSFLRDGLGSQKKLWMQ